ncbi:AAA family ATPase [Pelatocladus sp. BLCC-F211]|uniref:AAA family ATPase n=1 Tax=Pelatocladus sp. BLCC-F211 TaxID=3342752 RepID=UPI0035B778AE
MVATGAFIAINGLNPFSLLALGISGAIALFPKLSSKKNETQDSELSTIPTPGEFKIYRQAELNRTTASLLANGAILIAGEDGSGKSVLASAVVEKLQDDGFMVAFIEPATPKQMLLEIAGQFDIPTEDLEGKSLTADKLKRANESGSTHLIKANIKGVRTSDRSKVVGQFLIIQAQGTGFLVQADDGRIYKASTEPDAQIFLEEITADVGKPAITNIEAISIEDEPVGVAARKHKRSGLQTRKLLAQIKVLGS